MSDSSLSQPSTERQAFQFRLWFVLWMVALTGVIFGGHQLQTSLEANWNPGTLSWGRKAYFCLILAFAPTAAAIVLLMGRGSVAVPMAIGFLVAGPLLAYEWLFNHSGGGWSPLQLGFILGAWLGIVWLLSQRITLCRLLLSIPISYVLGAWSPYVTALFLGNMNGG